MYIAIENIKLHFLTALQQTLRYSLSSFICFLGSNVLKLTKVRVVTYCLIYFCTKQASSNFTTIKNNQYLRFWTKKIGDSGIFCDMRKTTTVRGMETQQQTKIKLYSTYSRFRLQATSWPKKLPKKYVASMDTTAQPRCLVGISSIRMEN